MSSTEGEEKDATESRRTDIKDRTGANDNIAASGVEHTNTVPSAEHVATANISAANSSTSMVVDIPAAHEETVNIPAAHEAIANTAATHAASPKTLTTHKKTANTSTGQAKDANTSVDEAKATDPSTAQANASNTSAGQAKSANTSAGQAKVANTSANVSDTSTGQAKYANTSAGQAKVANTSANVSSTWAGQAKAANASADQAKAANTSKGNIETDAKPTATTKRNAKSSGKPSTATKDVGKGGGKQTTTTKANTPSASSQGHRTRPPVQSSSSDSSDSFDYTSAIKKSQEYEAHFRQRDLQSGSPSTPPQPAPRSGLQGVRSIRPVPVPRPKLPPNSSRGRDTGPPNNTGPSTSGHPDTSAGSQRHRDTAIVWSSSSDSSDEPRPVPCPRKNPKKGKCNDSMRPCGVYRTPGGGANPNGGGAESSGEHGGGLGDVTQNTSRSEVNHDVTRIGGRRQISLRMSGRCKYCINIHDIGNDNRDDWRTRVDNWSDSSDDSDNMEGWSSRADGGSVRNPNGTGYTSVDDDPEMSDAELVLWVLEQRRAQRQAQQEARRHSRREAQLDYERDAHVIRRRPVPTPRGISRVRHSGGNTEARPRRTIFGSLNRGVRRLGAWLSRCCQPCQSD